MEYGKHLLHIVCRRCFYAFISDHRRPRGDASGRAGRPVLERQRRMQQGLGLSHPSDRRDGRRPHRSGRPAAGAGRPPAAGKALQPELPVFRADAHPDRPDAGAGTGVCTGRAGAAPVRAGEAL